MASVSICIPVYNGAKFIREAVTSALAQEHEPLEVIVCDNVSTDGTLDVIADLVADPRLRVVAAQEHVGMAANWNRAVRLATHELAQILSADDCLLPGAVARLAAPFAGENPPDLVFGDTEHLVEGDDRGTGKAGGSRREGRVEDLEQFTVGEVLSINVNAALFRRERLSFREDVGVVCDLDLFIRLAREGATAVSLPAAVTAYREHPGALSANRERMWSETLAVYARHAVGNPRQELYRRRIFRTLLWLTAYLAERGESGKAATYLERDGAILSTAQRVLLRGIARFPAAFRVLAALRKLRS